MNKSRQLNLDASGDPTPFPLPPGEGALCGASINGGSPDAGFENSPPSRVDQPAPAAPLIGRVRRSQTDWKTTFINGKGQEVALVDAQLPVTFTWCEQHLGISRRTLYQAREDGHLLTFTHKPSLTRTDWVYFYMTGQRNHGEMKRKESTCRLPRRHAS